MRGTSLIRICEVAGTGVRLRCGTCFLGIAAARQEGSPHLAAVTGRGPPGAVVTGQGWGEPLRPGEGPRTPLVDSESKKAFLRALCLSVPLREIIVWYPIYFLGIDLSQ